MAPWTSDATSHLPTAWDGTFRLLDATAPSAYWMQRHVADIVLQNVYRVV